MMPDSGEEGRKLAKLACLFHCSCHASENEPCHQCCIDVAILSAALSRARMEEREEIAVILDSIAGLMNDQSDTETVENCVAAIRRRGEQ